MWSYIDADAKIPDLEILRVNRQIHVEATQIFLEENTFEYEVSRKNTMESASRIKAYFSSYHNGNTLSNFIKLLESRPRLKRLHLTFYGSSWNLDRFRELGDKVVEEVSVGVKIQGCDFRDGPYLLERSEYTQTDIEFCILANNLEHSLLERGGKPRGKRSTCF
jgi:hypothetical protein